MAFRSQAKQARKETQRLIEQAREAGGETLASVGERLGVYTPPARTSGEDALAFINGLVWGALICAIAAFLLAPSDGRALRRRIKAQIDALLGHSTIEETEHAAASAMAPQPEAGVPAADGAARMAEPASAPG
jgi:hypothetical protein